MKQLLVLLILFTTSLSAMAIMPPETYQRAIDNSEIKAIAQIEKVKVIDKKGSIHSKKVWFKTIKAFNKTTPKEFIGYCKSVESSFPGDANIPIDGTIYYYPDTGEKVIVAVNGNHGFINLLVDVKEEELDKLSEKEWKHLMNH